MGSLMEYYQMLSIEPYSKYYQINYYRDRMVGRISFLNK